MHIRDDQPLDVTLIALLRSVDLCARQTGTRYCIVGATARDLLLTHCLGMPPATATRDVDFALAVETFGEFEAFKAALLGTGKFTDGKEPQAMHFTEAGGYPLDIIPFGGVLRADSTFAWPPDMAVVMNMVGYNDMYQHAVALQVQPDLLVKVASVPGLVMLKLFAWQDRHANTRRDAADVRLMAIRYHEIIAPDRLYAEGTDLLDRVDGDPQRMGIILLGRHMRQLCAAPTLSAVLSLLDDPHLQHKLVIHMQAGRWPGPTAIDAQELIELLILGLRP